MISKERKKIIKPIWLWVTAGLLLAGCANVAVSAQLPANQRENSSQTEPLTLSLDGRLVPQRYVELSLASGRRADSVLVEENTQVTTGEALIRLGGYTQSAAKAITAEEKVLLAHQALDALQQNAGTALAEAALSVRQAEETLALAEDRLASQVRGPSKQKIEQAHANLLLAGKQREEAQEDLRKAEQKFKNKKHVIWRFINKREFRLQLTLLRKQAAAYERSYVDAEEAYKDLISPVDETDVALLEAELAIANARLRQAERQRDELRAGPDPDLIEAATARLNAALAELSAAQEELRDHTLVSPIDGRVVNLPVKSGEWILPGSPAAVIGDLDAWLVETDDLKEGDLNAIQPGGSVRVLLDAYPEVNLHGVVDSIALTPTEIDGDVYYTMRILLEENDLPIRWGMSARIEIDR